MALGSGDDGDTDVEPSITLGLIDRVVVSKPPGWEVHDAGTPRQLHTWLRSLGSWPILWDPEFDFGFLHRLDVPSSGLILVATTYGAYYDLQLQLRSGMIGRDYVVLNHGWLKRRKVDARCQGFKLVSIPVHSYVGKHGKQPNNSYLQHHSIIILNHSGCWGKAQCHTVGAYHKTATWSLKCAPIHPSVLSSEDSPSLRT